MYFTENLLRKPHAVRLGRKTAAPADASRRLPTRLPLQVSWSRATGTPPVRWSERCSRAPLHLDWICAELLAGSAASGQAPSSAPQQCSPPAAPRSGTKDAAGRPSEAPEAEAFGGTMSASCQLPSFSQGSVTRF